MQLLFLTLAASLAAALPSSMPAKRQYPAQQATLYGIDPSQPFNLTATTPDFNQQWIIQNYYSDFLGGILGLRAYPIYENGTSSLPAETSRSNFTLKTTHYGTQLYAYAEAPCTSAAFCNQTAVQWYNLQPTENELLSFKQGNPGPTFGYLSFFGKYNGLDPVVGSTDYLTGAGDLEFAVWSVCDNDYGYQVIGYKGTNATCVDVLLSASAN